MCVNYFFLFLCLLAVANAGIDSFCGGDAPSFKVPKIDDGYTLQSSCSIFSFSFSSSFSSSSPPPCHSLIHARTHTFSCTLLFFSNFALNKLLC